MYVPACGKVIAAGVEVVVVIAGAVPPPLLLMFHVYAPSLASVIAWPLASTALAVNVIGVAVVIPLDGEQETDIVWETFTVTALFADTFATQYAQPPCSNL